MFASLLATTSIGALPCVAQCDGLQFLGVQRLAGALCHASRDPCLTDASKLVAFIEKVFGAKEKEGSRMLNADGSIGHVEVQLGDSVIMLFDHKEGWPGTPSFLRLYVEDAKGVLERAKEAGTTIITEITPLFFGEKVGRIRDAWGNFWWIHQRTEELDWPEQEKRMKDPEAMQNMGYVQKSLDDALEEAGK